MELLEQHFDAAFAAPDGIKKLRELILTLAMQGRLVPQDPNDQPASELLKEIEAEKQRLVKEGKIKAPKPLPAIKPEEVPYELPQGWEWVRLGDSMLKITDGTHHSPPNTVSGDFLYISAKNIKDDGVLLSNATYVTREIHKEIYSRCDPEYGNILYIKDGATTGIVTINNLIEPFSMLSSVALLKQPMQINNRFLLFTLRSPFFYKEMRAGMTGVAITRVTLKKLQDALIPLPPLPEQHRIVAKIDQLMARCGELEKLRAERERLRLTVHAAALNRVLAYNGETSSDAWRFITRHFGELYAVKPNVAELRKAILQLAVMGKLVPQDPNDPPASELLKEIEAEKQRLMKEGKIKAPKPLPAIKPEEMPYELPQGWEWVRLGAIGEFINGDRGKNYPNRDEYVPEGIPWINTGHIEPDGTLTQGDMHFITREKFNSLNSGKIEPGDLVYCLRGATFGKTAIVDPYKEGAIASSLMIIRPIYPCSNRYFYRYLTGPIGRSQIFRFDNGSAQPNLSANSVRLYVFPLPPLPEQHRIVAKIDQLMALCDTLERQIDAAAGKRTELLNAVMAQV